MRSPGLLLLPLMMGGLACHEKSSEGSSTAPPPASATPASAASSVSILARFKLPPSILETKRIRVGSDISYAPLESYKEGTTEVEGFDVDVCNAIAKKLDPAFSCDFQNDDFDKLLDDLGAGKFDIVMSAMSDHIARQEKADLIDYFRAGMSVLIQKGNPHKLVTLRDLCGKSLGAQKGTDEETFANGQNISCTNAGRAPLHIVTVKTDGESLAQLKAGKLAADLEDFPAAQLIVKTAGGGNDFELFGEPSGRQPYGIAVPKDKVQLREALVAALKEAVQDKTYEKLIQKWSLPEGSLTTVEVNAGG